jgi:hypothetical protein
MNENFGLIKKCIKVHENLDKDYPNLKESADNIEEALLHLGVESENIVGRELLMVVDTITEDSKLGIKNYLLDENFSTYIRKTLSDLCNYYSTSNSYSNDFARVFTTANQKFKKEMCSVMNTCANDLSFSDSLAPAACLGYHSKLCK